MNTAASRLMTRTFFSVNEGFTSVYSFREVAHIGLDAGLPELWDREVEGAKWILESPENDHLFTDKEAAVAAFGGVKGLATRNLTTKSGAFRRSVDGASLVFAHSLLDGAAFDYCRVIAVLDKAEFLPFVKDQKAAVRDVMSLGKGEILESAVNGFLEKLERESLFRKIDILQSICKPEPKFSALRDYEFDLDRLKALDRLLTCRVSSDQSQLDFLVSVDKLFFKPAMNSAGVR